MNEVIRPVLNYFFFHSKILHAQKEQEEYKAPKRTKRHKTLKKTTKQKHKNANKRIKIKKYA